MIGCVADWVNCRDEQLHAGSCRFVHVRKKETGANRSPSFREGHADLTEMPSQTGPRARNDVRQIIFGENPRGVGIFEKG
jgi:hypothetical protein